MSSFSNQKAPLSVLQRRPSSVAMSLMIRSDRDNLKAISDCFNENPKKGVEKCIGERYIASSSPMDVALFLQRNKLLNKQKIGEYLGDSDPFSKAVLQDFMQLLDFSELDFDIALRQMLNHFRLPGEAQKIDRILERFAIEFFKQNPQGEFANAEAAWAMAFATIMLNTDAHSNQVKKKMTKQEFIHNCRGINDGEDFPTRFLEEIYERIVLDEIRLKEDGALYPSAVKKGWITCKVTKGLKTIHKWKRRWFILLPDMLLYFKKPGEVEPVETINLSLSKITMKSASKEKKFCFQIRSSTNGGSPIVETRKHSQTINATVSASASLGKINMKSNLLLGLEESVEYTLALPSERELISWTKTVKRFIEQAKKPAVGKTPSQEEFKIPLISKDSSLRKEPFTRETPIVVSSQQKRSRVKSF